MSLQLSVKGLREDRANYNSELKVPSKPVEATFVHGTEVRIALGGTDRPMLLLPVSTSALREKLPEADGLAIEYAQYKGTSSATGYFLQVSSKDDQLESVFLDLVENVCSRVRNGEGSHTALASAIDEFRDLLSRSRQLVDRSRIVGLMGELLFLNTALDSNSKAATFWTGPGGGRRDFLFPEAAVEIKTTEQSTGRNVVIHSLAQLATDDADELFLMFYRLEENPGKGMAVSDLVQAIRAKLDSAEFFDKKLEEVGYNGSSSESWNAFRWSLLEAAPYRVADGFPRITPATFPKGPPAGVSQVTYQLDLDTAETFAIPDEVLSEKL